MVEETEGRQPCEPAQRDGAVAPVAGTDVDVLIIESPTAEIARVRADTDFTDRAKRLLERDKELLDRLAR